MALSRVSGNAASRTMCLADYDCIGFDLDNALCRYNIPALVQLEYALLCDFLVGKRGYDPTIRGSADALKAASVDLLCKGLTLDCARGNLLRLGSDGCVLTASHGTRKMTEAEIERIYGRKDS